MTRYTVSDEPSACGMHPGSDARWCRPCLRAKAATEFALRDTLRVGADGGVVLVTDEQAAGIRHMRAQGALLKTIARRYKMSVAIVSGILNGKTGSRKPHPKAGATPNQRRAAQWYSPIQGEREHTKTIPYPTSTTERA